MSAPITGWDPVMNPRAEEGDTPPGRGHRVSVMIRPLAGHQGPLVRLIHLVRGRFWCAQPSCVVAVLWPAPG